jgi:DNA mismatch repair protein MutS2
MSAPEGSARAGAAPALGDFSPDALEYPAIRAMFERLAPTSLGLRALRELAPRSSADARAAHARASEMVERDDARDPAPLGGVTDPLPPLAVARRFSRALERDELASLVAFFDAAARLVPWIEERAAVAPALAALAKGFPELAGLRARVSAVVDERGEVRAEASPKLARLLQEERELLDRIESILRRLLANATVRAQLSDASVHLRGGRRVLAVKQRSSGRIQGILHERSQSGETAFIEPRECVEPANRLAAVELDTRREEQRILLELTRELFEAEPRIALAAARLAELELAAIAAAFCREYGARVPNVQSLDGGEHAALVLRGARHPLLLEEARRGRLAEVVPIDVRVGGDFDLLVITGPNTGGKTLALKTVGTAALLARLGLPFSCGESSSIPLYDAVAADIGDEQEIRQNLSTFSSHLARIRAALERAGPRTLVLLDELGAGTDPDEGAALSDALLEELLVRRASTLATTHLGKLKEFAFSHARAENACVEFDPKTLRPAFRLLIGTPGESCALLVARSLGLDPRIVARAEARLVRREREVAELMERMRGAREEAERARSAAEDRLAGVARAEVELAARHSDLEQRSQAVEERAQRGLEERVRRARATAARAESLIGQLPTAAAAALRGLLEELERELSGAASTERRQAFLATLAKGRYVWVPRFGKRCLVTRVDKKRAEVRVRLGNLDASVAFDELSAQDGA